MKRSELNIVVGDTLERTADIVRERGYQKVMFWDEYIFADELIEELERRGLKLVPA